MHPAPPQSRPRPAPAPAPSPAPATAAADVHPEEWTNRRASEQALRAATARQASGRRRFVDPTTCERDYSDEELEFLAAIQEYKRTSGRQFPTWSEVLGVVRGLGYRRPGRGGD